MKVCAIDDDLLMLQHLESMLTEMGFEVVSAADVKTAFRLMSEQPCDAALVDILMPDRDGLEFIIEARGVLPGLRIVAMSGGGRLGAASLLQTAAGLGADATLIKPFSSSELEQALTAG